MITNYELEAQGLHVVEEVSPILRNMHPQISQVVGTALLG